MPIAVHAATKGSLHARKWAHLGGLVEEATAPSLLEEAQILVNTAAGELPRQVVPGENTLNEETALVKMTVAQEETGEEQHK